MPGKFFGIVASVIGRRLVAVDGKPRRGVGSPASGRLQSLITATWRDKLALKSRRQADYAWQVLAGVLSWGLDRGLVLANPCARGGRLYRGSRAEKIWTADDEATFLRSAPAHLHLPLLLALWTGQRQGDLLRLPWSAYDGTHIRLRQGKTGARVVVRVGAPLKAALDAAQKHGPLVLTNTRPWTSHGFQSVWSAAVKEAGIVGLTFPIFIASQAVISGVFSLTGQAIQLGHLSRMTVRYTSAAAIGQIYIPRVNWLLMAGVVTLVVSFGSSGNLAAAYGISVTGAMAMDAVLAGLVAAWLWGWGPLAALVFGSFFLLDFAYLAANALKIPSGGWLPLAIAAGFAATVVTWRRGRRVVYDRLYGHGLTVEGFLDRLDPQLTRVPGTAVFLTGNAAVVPMALLHNIKHNQVLHQKVVLLTVRTQDIPYVAAAQRLEVEKLGKGFYRVAVSYGFMDDPDIPRALERCRAHALPVDLAATSYFVARETLIPSPRPELNPLEERLFMLLTASNLSATSYFRIPPDQVVELGLQLEI